MDADQIFAYYYKGKIKIEIVSKEWGLEKLDLYFLGTGAGMPSTRRNVTSIALRLFEERGSFWLFDCGEGTQHQILNSPLKVSKLERIWITHLHGDHIYGLPGLLTSRSYQGGETPLTIIGPKGINDYIRHALYISQAHLTYTLDIVEIEKDGIVFQDEQFTVEAARIEHRIESYGYRLVEREQPGKLHLDKLKERGVLPGPIYGQLKQGNDVRLADGTTLLAEQFVGPRIPGRIVAIIGDTRQCDSARILAEQADVLVHEATFSKRLQELAYKYYHTTTEEAAQIAKTADVNALIMTHISSRYQEADLVDLLLEARDIFPNSYIANDFWTYPIAKK